MHNRPSRYRSWLLVFVAVFMLAAVFMLLVRKPAVPVTCSRRASIVGQGSVIKVKNTSNKEIALWIKTTEKTSHFTLRPYASTEFGWLEGFTFGENSTWTIGGEGYRSRTFSVDDLG